MNWGEGLGEGGLIIDLGRCCGGFFLTPLDWVIYCTGARFQAKVTEIRILDRVIYWVILQFSFLDRVIY